MEVGDERTVVNDTTNNNYLVPSWIKVVPHNTRLKKTDTDLRRVINLFVVCGGKVELSGRGWVVFSNCWSTVFCAQEEEVEKEGWIELLD